MIFVIFSNTKTWSVISRVGLVEGTSTIDPKNVRSNIGQAPMDFAEKMYTY